MDYLPTEATLHSCMNFVSKFFNVITIISLRSIIVPESTYYCDNTTNLRHLGECLLEVGLLEPNEHEKLISSNPYESKQFLFHEVLNKKVNRKEDYAKLIKALLKSGNRHVVEKILEKLKSSSFGTSIHAVNNVIENNDQANGLLTGADNNGRFAHADTVQKRWIKISKYAIFPLVITAGFLILFLGNRLNHSSLMDQIAAKNEPLVLSPANSTAEDDSRTARPQPSEMPTVVTVKSFQNSQHHQQSDVKNISTKDPLGVKISGEQILPKPSSTEMSQKQLPTTPPLPQEPISIEIGSPLDMRHLPGMKRIHLTISGGPDWKNWIRDNSQQAKQVYSLRLKGAVSPVEIRYFLSSFKNLTGLRIESLTGKICGKLFNVKSQTLSHDNLEYLGITHVEDNPCRSAYQFFKEAFDFPKLRSVEIVNLPIVAENEKYVVEFFQKIETQLKQLYLQNVFVRLGSHAFADSEFKKLVSLYSVFREPASEGAKSVFTNLNRATPNLVEISTNVECTEGEKLAFDKNWSKINGSKRMICDLRSSK